MLLLFDVAAVLAIAIVDIASCIIYPNAAYVKAHVLFKHCVRQGMKTLSFGPAKTVDAPRGPRNPLRRRKRHNRRYVPVVYTPRSNARTMQKQTRCASCVNSTERKRYRKNGPWNALVGRSWADLGRKKPHNRRYVPVVYTHRSNARTMQRQTICSSCVNSTEDAERDDMFLLRIRTEAMEKQCNNRRLGPLVKIRCKNRRPLGHL